jgi:hypothetical protein
MSAEETTATELNHFSSTPEDLYMGCFTHSTVQTTCGGPLPAAGPFQIRHSEF